MTMKIKCYLGQLLILLAAASSVVAETCKPPPCGITKIKKMWTADCYYKDLHEFPTCLRSDLEVLDLSYNRIRKLKKDDLKSYSSLKLLYLSDNLISQVDPEFFYPATGLTALDLSINDIRDLPPNIFNLPSLSKLYLSQNVNMNLAEAIDQAKPITSPITRLDISFNDLEALPDFGEMVHLLEYNISGNDLLELTPQAFAGLCNLKYLHNSNMSVFFESTCDCITINAWLQERKVTFQPFQCETPLKFEECSNHGVSEEDLLIYNRCKEKSEALILQSRLLNIGLPCIIAAVVITSIIIYCVCKKRKRAKLERQAKLHSGHEVNTVLMSDVESNHKT